MAEILDALDAMTAVGGVLNGTKMHLYKNDYIPGPGMTLADFVPARFVGYPTGGAVIGTWLPAFVNQSGMAQVSAPHHEFVATDDTDPNNAFGWYLTDTAGAALVLAYRYDDPLFFNVAYQGAVVEPFYVYPALG